MSVVRVLAPEPGSLDLATLEMRLRRLVPRAPFDDSVLAFARALSRMLATEAAARRIPAISALAFWLREAEVRKLLTRGRMLERPGEMLVPRGLAFHMPPANVDTMFIYSWFLSLVAGNANIVRVSPRVLSTHTWLWESLRRLLEAPEHSAIAAGTLLLSYGHELDVTEACSAACDVRVVWGGDATIASVRQVRLNPLASEIVFSDRYSFSVLDARSYMRGTEEERDRVAERFFNDAYWFDQLGCASPRLLAFVGRDPDVEQDFWMRLSTIASRRGYMPAGADVMAKFVAACSAVTAVNAHRVTLYSPGVTVLAVTAPADVLRTGPGAGYFYSVVVDHIDDLSDFVCRRDQTVSVFGLDWDVVERWLRLLNGRGVDRIVAMGDALTFDAVWDGMDLLEGLTRRLTVRRVGLGMLQ